MKVVGEEGTPNSDFILYLKSEFIDRVYLQQNTFDKVDSACGAERQEYTFNNIRTVLDKQFNFDDKSKARTYFLKLQQEFLDWNYTPWQSVGFNEAEERIDKMLAEA